MSPYIVGVWFMKTKIIYISGSEIFEMSQVRAIFEEIRENLGLDKNTILFGVPVDSDDALADKNAINTDIESQKAPIQTIVTEEPITETQPIISIIEEQITENIADDVEQVAEDITPETEELITTSAEIKPIIEETVPVAEDENDTQNAKETIIPILSILATNSSDSDDEPNVEATETNEETIIDEVDEKTVNVEIQQTTIETNDDEEVTISDIKFDAEVDESDAVLTKQIITDMLNDEAPIAESEKTIEQLLESMTPLREDFDTDNQPEENLSDFDFETPKSDEDEDATLAQLASEFAKTEDKIVVDNKPETHGKIGKLKNILPFKKAKREDNSLMGDLFGWAGIAANDEDFSMPGFFTPSASRKQGS